MITTIAQLKPVRQRKNHNRKGEAIVVRGKHSNCAPKLSEAELHRVAQLFAKTAILLDSPGPYRNKALVMRAIGTKLREQRRGKNVSRSELAQLTGFDARFLLNLETGILMPEDIVAYVLDRITNKLGVERIKVPEDFCQAEDLEFENQGVEAYNK